MPQPNASASSEDDDAPVEAGDELQFDQAEFTTPAPLGPSCSFCKRPIDDAYYELGGKICCASCRQQVEAALRGGSSLARVIKALIFGSVAAMAGAALYYAIIRITGYNIGLVAIVVGFMVGGAVRKGTSNRGGRFYQFLALLLAYIAIGLMHVPMLIEHAIKTKGEPAQQAEIVPEKSEKDRAGVDGEPKAPVTKDLAKLDGEPKTPAAKDRAGVDGAPKAPVIVATELIAFLILFLFALPVLAVISDPISGLIYSFALWEAWRINKGVRLVFNGPFRVSTGESNAPAREDVDDAG